MGILQLPTQVPGMVGVLPNQKFMLTTDNLAAVTTAGYLNQVSLEANPVSSTDIIQCLYSFNQQTGVGTYALFTVTITNGVITLVQWAGDSGVIVPTIINHIATYVDTNGTISEDAATAINGGNIQAGLSGTAGYVSSFPGTASKGSLHLTAVANTGDTITTISNVAMGQASVVSIPDPANAVGRFMVGATATPFINGNFPMNSGTGGLMVDSGVSVASLATTSNAVLLTPAANQAITIHDLTLTLGNFIVSAGSITATAGAISAGTTVTAGTGVTATTGNIVASAGNVTAGASGAAGTHISFPATAANGTLILAAANAGGAFNTTISNGTMGQSTVYSMGDIGASTGGIVVATSAVRMKVVAASAVGGGNADQSITDAFCTTGSVVIGSWTTQTSPAEIIKIVPGNGSFVVTSTADAGAGTFSYVIYK